jgi:hypothetical protein
MSDGRIIETRPGAVILVDGRTFMVMKIDEHGHSVVAPKKPYTRARKRRNRKKRGNAKRWPKPFRELLAPAMVLGLGYSGIHIASLVLGNA